ncbi:MAG: alcohol dehydrogenase catalytic domain-containing protein [Ignavibacteriales bacterium]|nr:alcohol dehydrogenase catalytic domain-containing protein [Ignavibacteriales bacterium]
MRQAITMLKKRNITFAVSRADRSFRSWLEQIRSDGADRPEPILPDQPARGAGVSPGEDNGMKAITVEPGKPGTARLEDIPEPDPREGSVLVEAIAVGVCGTDAEIAEGKYGWAPAGHTRLVLGHESLGRVLDPGPNSSLKPGDLVVGIVRRPDPVPCPNCAVGEWDMCRNGQYTGTRHQADPRVHVGALAHRARVRRQGGPVAGHARRAARADDRDREGARAGRDGRPALLLGGGDGARDRRGPDRPARGVRGTGCSARRSTSSTASRPARSRSSCGRSARPTTPGASRTCRSSRTRSSSAPASAR